ncbi:hypothetical protein Pryu01_01687 [Paraliobacillus ryukyuensis]|uniref:Uncharacterized protein n=2 Tax=Paraliobacillus ryukyuensis TaxID=200904 RepID=A0A366E748_9BACI|nr:hypothetical protein DES48_10553 [Paraliobacillus ryukyuensis]
MMYLIKDAFQPIGFHLVDYLLKQGEEVVGVDKLDQPIAEHASLMVGRNANFIHYETIAAFLKDQQSNLANYSFIFIGQETDLIEYFEDKGDCYAINSSELLSKKNTVTSIELPLLEGRWLTQQNNRVVWQQQFFPVEASKIEAPVVDLDVFISIVYHILKASLTPGVIKIKHKKAEIKQVELPFIIHSISC